MVASRFFDGVVNTYTPTIYEITLGLGGVALSMALVVFMIKAPLFLLTARHYEPVERRSFSRVARRAISDGMTRKFDKSLQQVIALYTPANGK